MFAAPTKSECNGNYESVQGVIYKKPSCNDGFAHFYLRTIKPRNNDIQQHLRPIPNELIVLPNNHVRFQTIKCVSKCEPKCEPIKWDNIGEETPHATMKAYFVDEQVETTTMVRTYAYTATHGDGKNLSFT